MRPAEPAEKDAQHRPGVGGGADGGAGVDPHPLLVDDDRRRQPFEYVDLRPGQSRHEALDECAVGLVDQPLRFRGDRVENQRALARPGDTGEHREPTFRDLDADVLEIVLSRTVHTDQAVTVRNVQRLPPDLNPTKPARAPTGRLRPSSSSAPSPTVTAPPMSSTPSTSSTRELALAIARIPLSANRWTTRSAGTSLTAKLITGIRASGRPSSITSGSDRNDTIR